MSIITVKVTDPENDTRVVLWERDDAHPDGEAFIAGPGEFKVADTPGVRAAIRSGRIEKIEKKAAAKPKDEPVVAAAKPKDEPVVAAAAPKTAVEEPKAAAETKGGKEPKS